MANLFKISAAAQNAACNAITALLNVGGAGTVKVWMGTAPTNVADADLAAANLLATLTFSATAFANAIVGVATANAITSDTNAAHSGTATFFRLYNNAGTCVAQGTAGTSGCDMNFDVAAIVAGGTVAISAMTITVPLT